MQAIALDPRYGSRKTREFVTGGKAGQLLLNSRVRVMQAAYPAVRSASLPGILAVLAPYLLLACRCLFDQGYF